MRNCFLLLVPMLLFSWQEYKHIDNITIYKKYEEKFEFVQFKAHIIIPSSIDNISKVILNTKTYTSWLSDCIDAKKIDEHTYLLMQPPWPLNQRQVLAKIAVTDYFKKRKITLASINKKTENSSAIWFNYLYAEFILEEIDKENTKVTLSLIGDPGGYPPAWIINLMAWKIPYQSLRDLDLYVQNANTL